MIVLTSEQFNRICPKQSILGQCEWFRNKYGCTLIINSLPNYRKRYKLTFKTDKEETFFRLQYSDIIALSRNPWDELKAVIQSWRIGK